MENPTRSTTAPSLLQRIVFGRRPGWTIVRIIIWTTLLLLGSRFVILPVKVEGASMLPTYHENGVNLINRLAYLRHGPKRGDVVAIKYAGTHIMLLKRVIGLPGETVAFQNGHAMIDGNLLEEPYLKFPCNWNRPEVKVGEDEYFVVGDNRSMPAQDHTFGRAKREKIVGRAIF